MRTLALVLATLLPAACTAAPAARVPEIRADAWLNGAPVDGLRGRVRLVEFWTFGCINCVRTVPAIREIHHLYSGRGLVVVGVHSPEFEQERDVAAVRDAVARMEIPYLVAVDTDFRLWNAFGNRYWPTTYLVGRDGTILWRHIGELHPNTAAWQEAVARIEHALGP